MIDFILHIDHHLVSLFERYGAGIYLILFLIIFCETGLVMMPFLPGDSLLFAVGALAAQGGISVGLVAMLLIIAAILGDAINYVMGNRCGRWFLQRKRQWLFNRSHFDRAHQFYERHGGKTIVLARFIPMIRTFAPFVAGISGMTYWRFALYNVVGGSVWVLLFIFSGYLFGNLALVKRHFTLLILAIIIVSLLPLVMGLLKQKDQAVSPTQEPQ